MILKILNIISSNIIDFYLISNEEIFLNIFDYTRKISVQVE